MHVGFILKKWQLHVVVCDLDAEMVKIDPFPIITDAMFGMYVVFLRRCQKLKLSNGTNRWNFNCRFIGIEGSFAVCMMWKQEEDIEHGRTDRTCLTSEKIYVNNALHHEKRIRIQSSCSNAAPDKREHHEVMDQCLRNFDI
eukprot:14455_1